MDEVLELYGYQNSDTFDYFSIDTRGPTDALAQPLVWSAYDRVSVTIRGPSTAGTIGDLVATIDSAVDSDLFDFPPAAPEVMGLNVGAILGLEPFTDYEALLKVHDVFHERGIVLMDYKTNNNRPTLVLKVYPGGDENG